MKASGALAFLLLVAFISSNFATTPTPDHFSDDIDQDDHRHPLEHRVHELELRVAELEDKVRIILTPTTTTTTEPPKTTYDWWKDVRW